jgi:hypothetical protein
MVMMLTPTEESVCDLFNPWVPELNASCDMQKTRIQTAGLIFFASMFLQNKTHFMKLKFWVLVLIMKLSRTLGVPTSYYILHTESHATLSQMWIKCNSAAFLLSLKVLTFTWDTTQFGTNFYFFLSPQNVDLVEVSTCDTATCFAISQTETKRKNYNHNGNQTVMTPS